MKLTVNGESKEFKAGCPLSDLLKQMRINGPRVATVVNDNVVPKTDRAKHKLNEGDRVEILTFAGGG